MGGSRNNCGIDAKLKQLIDIVANSAADDLGEQRAMRRTGVCNTHDVHARQVGEHTGMIAAHDSHADDPEPNRHVFRGTTHVIVHPRGVPG
jgi:hypothetical protein